jgi:hypothetical protein
MARTALPLWPEVKPDGPPVHESSAEDAVPERDQGVANMCVCLTLVQHADCKRELVLIDALCAPRRAEFPARQVPGSRLCAKCEVKTLESVSGLGVVLDRSDIRACGDSTGQLGTARGCQRIRSRMPRQVEDSAKLGVAAIHGFLGFD